MASFAPSAVHRALRALAMTLALAGACAPEAWAQATLDPRALDQLAPPPPGTAPAAPTPPATPPAAAAPGAAPPAGTATPRPRKPAKAAPAKPKPPAPKPTTAKPVPPPAAPSPPAAPAVPQKLPAVIVPSAPPAAPVLPPPLVVPTRQPPPPTPVPIVPDAPGVASVNADGLRVTFGPDRADLNPASANAIVALAHAAPGPDASFTVTAFAPGGDDPSTPRRLSLSRALAVRSALMEAGIASVRIYVKALGASAPAISDGPPDRADIVVSAMGMPAAPSAAAPPPGEAMPLPSHPANPSAEQPPPASAPLQKAAP